MYALKVPRKRATSQQEIASVPALTESASQVGPSSLTPDQRPCLPTLGAGPGSGCRPTRNPRIHSGTGCEPERRYPISRQNQPHAREMTLHSALAQDAPNTAVRLRGKQAASYHVPFPCSTAAASQNTESGTGLAIVQSTPDASVSPHGAACVRQDVDMDSCPFLLVVDETVSPSVSSAQARLLRDKVPRHTDAPTRLHPSGLRRTTQYRRIHLSVCQVAKPGPAPFRLTARAGV
jgi:hypothetical protein